MFKKIIFWCEFPKQVDWKKAESLLKEIPSEIYVAVKSKQEYLDWKNKTTLLLYPWPILPKSQGYWFSGFTSKKSIDTLNQFKGMKIKIDLEPPLPKWKYTTPKIICYAIKKIFQKPGNSEYLAKKINNLTKSSQVELISKPEEMLINEFPFAEWYLKNQGMYINTRDNPRITKNIMCYTSFAGSFWRPLLRAYLKLFTKKAIKKDPRTMFSVGLIGTGILQTEKTYKNTKQFQQDLQMIKNSGAKKVAVYSLESILKRPNPQEWVSIIRKYV
ncbi:MAG: hypothetical protein KKG60_03135 [Nanoarchaeota archaeon]|nr:hypothetical protein [Nanoarchaeota archaeon]